MLREASYFGGSNVHSTVSSPATSTIRLRGLYSPPSYSTTSQATHLPWGVPEPPDDAEHELLLHQRDYVIGYDTDLRVPLWTAYRLRDTDLEDDLVRTECFRPDPRLLADENAFCADYDEPIFDRGHMVPNASMERSLGATRQARPRRM